MPVSPFERDAEPDQPVEGKCERRCDNDGRPEMHASPAERDDQHGADEMLDEPGYGHGV